MKQKEKNNLIWLGTIVNTHALKGELRILSNSNDIENSFKVGTKVYFENHEIPFEIESYRLHKKFILIKFKGFDDISKVLEFKSLKIFKEIHLSKEEFFLKDLIGCEVINDNEAIGKVVDLLHQKVYDSIIVKLFKNSNTINVPLIDNFFVKFDQKNNKVYVDLSEDFINIES